MDTGDTARKSDCGYMPRLNTGFSRIVDIRVVPDEEIGPLNASQTGMTAACPPRHA